MTSIIWHGDVDAAEHEKNQKECLQLHDTEYIQLTNCKPNATTKTESDWYITDIVGFK